MLDAPAERLTIADGVITDPATGETTTYWELMGGRRFERQATGQVRPKSPDTYTIVGTSVPRLDIPGKVAGLAVFVDDMDLPDMLHARVVRPPGYRARLESVDIAAVESMPGVAAVVRDGSFLAVAAEREEQAVAAAERLAALARWQGDTPLPDDEQIYAHLLNATGQRFLVVDGVPTADPIPPLEPPAHAAATVSAAYYRPFLRHASLGPSSAAARMQDERLTIWTHSQGVYPLRIDIAQVLGMALDDIRIIHRDGPGCYGHNGADDVALDAALVARAVPGRPVLLKWTRGDENLWEPFGPAMLMHMQASLDASGNLLNWSHETKSYSHSARPRPEQGASSLIAAWHLAQPLHPPAMRPGSGYHGGIHRNADPLYAFPNRRIVKHFMPDSPLRHSALRSLGAFSNIFASESFIDEVCAVCGADPGRVSPALPHRPARAGRGAHRRRTGRLARRGAHARPRAGHCLLALQEHNDLLRRRGGSRSRSLHRRRARAARPWCGRRRTDHQPGRSAQPVAGRHRPVHELDADGSRSHRARRDFWATTGKAIPCSDSPMHRTWKSCCWTVPVCRRWARVKRRSALRLPPSPTPSTTP